MSTDTAKLLAEYNGLVQDRSDWENEAKDISDYLLPGRGVFAFFTKPRRRKLSPVKVINPRAREALRVLTSGLQGGLTSPARPWFKLKFSDSRLSKVQPLKLWLEDCEKKLYSEFAKTNFYPAVHSFYTEFAGFGTGALFVTEGGEKTFSFHLLTFGEYVFALNADGYVDKFYRVLTYTPRQLKQKFGDAIPADLARVVEKGEATQDTTYYTVIHGVYPLDKPDNGRTIKSVYFLLGGMGNAAKNTTSSSAPAVLKEGLYYEFPVALSRWDVIGVDTYGVGPGSEALPDIKRLQEMEKSFLMATHKDIDPPVNAPARMRGQLNTLPGGRNYYVNPAETINEVYRRRFDYRGVGSAVDRVERRIERVFYNDVFLTASRDPNASPLKATEVNVRDDEKMLRLGPVIERLHTEFLSPLIERCFNIMLRAGKFVQLPPQFAQMVSSYDIELVSPLAQAQKMLAARGVQNLLAFTANVAQFNPGVLDKIDTDAAIDEYADISGAPVTVVVPTEAANAVRQQRAQVQAQKEKMAQNVALAQAQGAGALTQSQVAKNYADAGSSATDALTGMAPQ